MKSNLNENCISKEICDAVRDLHEKVILENDQLTKMLRVHEKILTLMKSKIAAAARKRPTMKTKTKKMLNNPQRRCKIL